MRARRWRQILRRHRGRRASKLMRASRVSRSVRASKLSRASTPKRSRDRNKQQRRGNPRRSNRKYLHAFLHDQARRIGHRPERLAPHHATAQGFAAPDGQHGQPGNLHAPVRIGACNTPRIAVPGDFQFTEPSGNCARLNEVRTGSAFLRNGQQHPTAAGASRSSAHRGTHRGRIRCSRPDRSRW